MLRRAVERGVPITKLASALNVDTSHIHRKVGLLDGICAEAVDLLKDQQFSANLSTVIRKMKPTRQIESIELMIAANSITVAYAEALLAATPQHLLVGGQKPKKLNGVTADQMMKMEREMGNLEGQFKLAQQSYGQDVLNLVLAKGFLAKLLDNKAVARFLSQRQPDVMVEFQHIVETVALDKG